MKLKVIVAVSALLVMVPMAMPKGKGKPASVQMSVSCTSTTTGGTLDADGDIDICSMNVTNLVAGKAYQLQIVNNCSAATTAINYIADSNGQIIDNNISPPEGDPNICTTTNWTFYLFTYGKNGNQ